MKKYDDIHQIKKVFKKHTHILQSDKNCHQTKIKQNRM